MIYLYINCFLQKESLFDSNHVLATVAFFSVIPVETDISMWIIFLVTGMVQLNFIASLLIDVDADAA